jgi:N-acetylglutamate synthase-like GNAT family acetyltransferase
MTIERAQDVAVRVADEVDVVHAATAAALIAGFAGGHDIAMRSVELIEDKIRRRQAALALHDGELIGFGYWSSWEGGKFVSHSGLAVRRDFWDQGIGKRLKRALFESSRSQLPGATLMSLTSSPKVKALNLGLGFQVVPLDRLTVDPAFWEGCRSCRNFAAVQARGERCCCEGMILLPEKVC